MAQWLDELRARRVRHFAELPENLRFDNFKFGSVSTRLSLRFVLT